MFHTNPLILFSYSCFHADPYWGPSCGLVLSWGWVRATTPAVGLSIHLSVCVCIYIYIAFCKVCSCHSFEYSTCAHSPCDLLSMSKVLGSMSALLSLQPCRLISHFSSPHRPLFLCFCRWKCFIFAHRNAQNIYPRWWFIHWPWRLRDWIWSRVRVALTLWFL